MRNPTRFASGLTLAVLVASALLTGCAKKAVQAPPAPSTPPATTPVPTTPPTPTEPAPTEPAMTPDRVVAQLQPVFFAYDSELLDERARAALDANARLLRDHATVAVRIEGHCDERGTIEYNLALGERRATAVRDYLVRSGIDGGRVTTLSYGKERPFAEGDNEEAYAQNRRAQFVTP